jgi:hypothetical protein
MRPQRVVVGKLLFRCEPSEGGIKAGREGQPVVIGHTIGHVIPFRQIWRTRAVALTSRSDGERTWILLLFKMAILCPKIHGGSGAGH